MSKYAVVYWSGGGNTAEMAKAVVSGFEGAEATLLEADQFTAGDVANYDGFAFGCSAQGSEVLEEGTFQPMWDAVKSSLAGKKIALFGSYGWGGGEFADIWKAEAEESGITVVDVCTCQESPDEDAVTACRALAAALVTA